MYSLSQQVLRTDASGIPLEWIDFREAVRIYHLDQVVFALGKPLYQIRGGHNAISGRRSIVQVNSIVGTHGDSRALLKSRAHYIPPLNNQTLFARDVRLCMYCGDQHSVRGLSRDHILPLSRGGTDTWNNVVTACKRCNNRKAGRTPEQAGMEAAGGAVHADARRIHLFARQAHPCRPDGIFAGAFPAHESPACSS